MNENIQALLQKVAESEELQSRFEKVSTPEEAYEIAKEIQGGYTREEFLEAAKALAEAANDDIDDADLAAAAGGVDEPEDAGDRPVPLSEIPFVGGQATGGLTHLVATSVIPHPGKTKGIKAMAV